MIEFPDWFSSNADFELDKSAYAQVCQGATTPAPLHRAARHHHWHQSNESVRGMTSLPSGDAKTKCKLSRWQGIVISNTGTRAGLVTHLRVAYQSDEHWKKLVHKNAQSADDLRLLAIAWHQRPQSLTERKTLWLTEQIEIDSGSVFDSDSLHRIVAKLGLWHFGEMSNDRDSAVLRIHYRLDNSVPLYKPDWRHAYDAFYFATTPGVEDHGLTRDLQTGDLVCKEWITGIDQLDPARHIVAAQYVVPSTTHCHYDLAPSYWTNVREEVLRIAGVP